MLNLINDSINNTLGIDRYTQRLNNFRNWTKRYHFYVLRFEVVATTTRGNGTSRIKVRANRPAVKGSWHGQLFGFLAQHCHLTDKGKWATNRRLDAFRCVDRYTNNIKGVYFGEVSCRGSGLVRGNTQRRLSNAMRDITRDIFALIIHYCYITVSLKIRFENILIVPWITRLR